MNALKRKWRWLCTECDTEGKGKAPKVCPNCGRSDSWYHNNCTANDPRSMREILMNDVFGHLKKKKETE
jgi:rRNA maturation endonuclease Nob1